MQTKAFALVAFLSFVISQKVTAQIEVDFADTKAKSQEIDLNTQSVIGINRLKDVTYKAVWKREKHVEKFFELPSSTVGGTASDKSTLEKCDEAVQKIMAELNAAKDETSLKASVAKANGILAGLAEGDCKDLLKRRIDATRAPILFDYTGKLGYNETLTLTITKIGLDGKQIGTPLTYVFTTEEKTRWVTHFGLTYTPNLISKTQLYYSQDSTVANTYRVAKQNDNGFKAWDNISATINFTYPFSAQPRSVDLGFTAGFGLSPSFQLSGHAGFSAIIGTNVILSTGVAFMQKQRLRGEFYENKIIKTNLTSDALHEKVWVPEMFFTIGFRFNKNPFGGSSDKKEAAAEKKPATTQN